MAIWAMHANDRQWTITLSPLWTIGMFARFRLFRHADRAISTHAVNGRAIQLIEEGNALEAQGRPHDAIALYRAALAEAPTLPRAHLNVGNSLLAQGDAAAALTTYEAALALDPTYVGGHFNRGNALLALGRMAQALSAYQRSAEIDPGFADAHVAAGGVLEDFGRTAEAAAAYQTAVELRPRFAPYYSNLGSAMLKLGRYEEAVACQRRSVELDPALPLAHNNLGNALKTVGRLEEAEASYRRVLALAPNDLDARSNLLFCLNYRDSATPEARLEEARAYGAVASRLARAPFEHWRGTPDPDRTLTIGLVSGDLRHHPAAYFLESVLAALHAQHRDRLSVCAYVTAQCDDAVSARLRSSVAKWVDVRNLNDEQFAQRIHGDAVDVLIDLSGHTAHTRLPVFAWRPSPVQVAWLGYFATTGVAEIDYLIADHWTLPPALESAFTERIVRMPDTRLCFTAPDPSPLVSELPANDSEGPTFGCFNHVAKMTDAVVAVWAQVLKKVPHSTLLLKSPPLAAAEVRQSVSARFEAAGVARQRIVMEGLSARADYLATYHRIDVALDPFPYPGGTTTAEALWMGVPVVTLAGSSFLSRQGLGLLGNVGLESWSATTVDDYVHIAVTAAKDLAALAALRDELRQRMRSSPIMDADRFASDLQALLRRAWGAWCEQRSARGAVAAP